MKEDETLPTAPLTLACLVQLTLFQRTQLPRVSKAASITTAFKDGLGERRPRRKNHTLAG
jgi:hypothetical protein